MPIPYNDDHLTQLAQWYDPSPIVAKLPSDTSTFNSPSLGMNFPVDGGYSGIINGEQGGTPGKPKGLDPKQIENMMAMASPKLMQPHFMGTPAPRVQQMQPVMPPNVQAMSAPAHLPQVPPALAALLQGRG